MAQAQLESEVEFFRGYKYVLSNFFRFDLTFEGQKYHSVEQAYQVKKATIYGDEDAKRRILFTMNAHRAWLIGKDIKVDDKWSEKRVEVMRELLKAKLEQCPTYYRKLLSCKGLIVEAVPNQTFWSAGLEKEELVKLPRDQWPGENMLGKLHMELRDQIRKRKTEVIEPPKAKRAKKEEATEPETLFDQAMGTSDMFATQPFEESKQGTPRPQTVPASAANHFDIPQPFETAPTNSPDDDLWEKVSPEEDAAIAEFLNSVAADVDNNLEHNSEYLQFFSHFKMKCCWCTFEKELIPGKRFCKACDEQGRECRYCHRPMPEQFYKWHHTRCNSCFKKSEKQKAKRRLGL